MDTSRQQDLLRCCTHRLESIVRCCGNVVRVCSDRAMHANGPLAKHILGGGGKCGGADPEMADSEVISQLYQMFINGSSNDEPTQEVHRKSKSETTQAHAGRDLNLRSARVDSRSKSIDNGFRVLVNAFMKALPNIVIATGDNNSIRTGEVGRKAHQPPNHPSEAPDLRLGQDQVGLSRDLFERLLRDIKRVEDAALECISTSRFKAKDHFD